MAAKTYVFVLHIDGIRRPQNIHRPVAVVGDKKLHMYVGYVCMYACMYVYIYIYIYIYMYIYICACMITCLYVCIHVYIHTFKHT